MSELRLQIMGVRLRSQLKDLCLNLLLLALGLLLRFLLLIPKTAVIHDAADRRSRIWRNLNEVKASLFGEPSALMGAHMTELTATLVNNHDDGDTDLVIDSPTLFQVFASLPLGDLSQSLVLSMSTRVSKNSILWRVGLY